MIRWLCEVRIPFSYAISKNKAVRWGNGHTYTPSEHKGLRDALSFLLLRELNGIPVFPRKKIWLDIHVEKPDMRGDAINVLDFVADAVKDAMHIDDRWYSVFRLDWTVKKDNPLLYVRIGQEESH